MAIAAKQKLTFAIDDALTVDENIASFALTLKAADAELAHVLTASLANYSNDVPVDQDTLLDALFAATAPKEEARTNAQDEGGGQ